MATLTTSDDDSTFSMPSNAEMLSSIRNAILDITTTGQSYTIMGGRTFTAGSLDSLRKLETDYEQRIYEEQGFNGRTYGNFSQD